ncbi:MAG: lysophospholipid acyltransferase family protein [Alphaproteobacteria bacterium]
MAAAPVGSAASGRTGHLRSLAFNSGFLFLTAVLGVLGLPLLLAPRRMVMRFGRFWARSVLAFLRATVGLDCEVRGLDNIPPGPCIIAMKHQSTWDTLILPVVLHDPAVVLKRELLWVPFYGWYASRAGSIAIDRGGRAAALRRMLRAARRAAEEGRPVVIFPEGTRTAPGRRLPYQPGIAALYQTLAVPLVPAAVNSGLFWSRRSFLKRPGRITLEFLDPIPPGLSRRQLMPELERRIETATEALERGAGYRRATGNQSSSPLPRICSSE